MKDWKRGRVPKKEQTRRFKVLAGFIFNFRYATLEQIHTFSQLIMNLTSSRNLVRNSVNYGYINSYFDAKVKTKIYYLTEKGKTLIFHDEPLSEYYFFKKTFAGPNTFLHHNMVVQTYFLTHSHISIKEWISEEVARMRKKRREKIPDALILLEDGVKIALEAESWDKRLAVLKNMVSWYRYDIEKISKYDVCLVVASDECHYEGLKRKFIKINPDFFNKRIILTDITKLEHGIGYYQGEPRHLEDALALLKKG
jgi:hypothetical protein